MTMMTIKESLMNIVINCMNLTWRWKVKTIFYLNKNDINNMYNIISVATDENKSERNHNIQITNIGNELVYYQIVLCSMVLTIPNQIITHICSVKNKCVSGTDGIDSNGLK